MTESTRAQRIAAAIGNLDAGGLAELRRLRPEDAGGPTFWRMMNRWEGEPDPHEAPGLRAWREQRCGVLFAALATGVGLPRPSLGEALAQAGYAELRLTRLLHAGTDQRPHEVRTAVHYLASKGLGAHPDDLSGLLGLRAVNAERLRRKLARDYFSLALRKA